MSIKFENTEVMGWEHAIRGMRNPLNSWGRSDSESYYTFAHFDECYNRLEIDGHMFEVGQNDLDLMKRLRNSGSDHRKFMRMITVYVDITAPLYWWKEFDTYKVGTVANSCSTMHKIHAKEFTLEDFSCEHLNQLIDEGGSVEAWYDVEDHDIDDRIIPFLDVNTPLNILELVIDALNINRKLYLETKDKKYWWQMIQLLPSSYNQKRTVMMNYEVLANIYKSRKNHKLDEWSIGFCDWIKTLPYSELITGEFK